MSRISRFLHRSNDAGGAEASAPLPRRRVTLEARERAVYVVGDVHGCLRELIDLEAEIARDAAKFRCEKLIVMLGDYIDRGPASAGVIDHLLAAPPNGFERLALVGNHEAALLDFIDGTIGLDAWLGLGSAATLSSYGIQEKALGGDDADERARAAIPAAHVEFLRSLPVLVETERFICVHAGLIAGLPVGDHSDHDLVWTRPFGTSDDYPKWVVHGHTPVDSVRREGRRINLDTGAFHTGRLSALRIWRNKARILSNAG